VKDIANHKLWPLDKIVVKETLQIINALGGDKWLTFVPTKLEECMQLGFSN
jgi:hypothetical protein